MQDDLFARARNDDPVTSHLAADMVVQFASDHQRLITNWLKANEAGGTIYEIAGGTGIDHIAVARRMKELETLGHADRSDLTRPTPTGRKAKVWKYSA